MSNETDAQLLSAVKAGNIKAYRRLFMKYYKPLCLKAYLVLDDMQQAETAVENIFVQLWEQKAYKDIPNAVGGYLCKLVHDNCIAGSIDYPHVSVREEHPELPTYPQAKTNLVTPDEYIQRLVTALHDLPAEQQEVVKLIFGKQKEHAEAAQLMGISVHTISQHLSLAMQELRREIFLNTY
ncbi:sigma-70 family RNA polymerase sigma factor [Chitinophaga pendula]|uniref:RNA polymerase sigma factor n=1 Tax=Chitinophaga TaxID=79328 RepID=UPI000BAF13C6|nr:MULTISPECIES: sigma-70 family RNA polymerase sigma factor [Chitinophaga]ASZ11697.1 hypothetical protein CK934_12365 [Chitinophaga sp. MD30]UCJ05287.1 sigma-70 family RNA polymerase sigma factor [Chitinophaga pendula]